MTSILYLIKTTLMQLIQVKLSKKLKTFSKVFYAFVEFRFIFNILKKKDDPQRLYISEIGDCERRA